MIRNRKLHEPDSPLLIGRVTENDVVRQAEQRLWKDGQMDFLDLL